MTRVIDFQAYKEKRDADLTFRLEAASKLEELKADKVVKRSKEEFDHSFLQLVDIFMQKYYPEYQWRFSLFLDEIGKDWPKN